VHAAPPVRVTLGRSAAWTALVALAWAAALSNLSAWAAFSLQASPAVAGAVALVVATAVASAGARQAWRSQVPGELLWDGRNWQWRSAACDVSVAIDAGSRVLLDVRTVEGARHWLVAEGASVGGDWIALRAALYGASPREPGPAPAT